jgi:hypothetical protein
MSTIHQDTVLDEVLDPVARCFTPDVARQIASLRADATLQARLDAFAEKANEGELTDEDREQYDAYVEAIDLVSILQAKARQILANSTAS